MSNSIDIEVVANSPESWLLALYDTIEMVELDEPSRDDVMTAMGWIAEEVGVDLMTIEDARKRHTIVREFEEILNGEVVNVLSVDDVTSRYDWMGGDHEAIMNLCEGQSYEIEDCLWVKRTK